MLQKSYSDQIRYAMNDIDLAIQEAQAAGGGELLSPDIYDAAVGRLNIMKGSIKDKKAVQDIDEKIARYGIAKNNLIKRIEKEAKSDANAGADTISSIIYNDEAEYNSEKRQIFQDNLNDPNALINTRVERELQWAQRIAEENEDYKARKGNYSIDLSRKAQTHLDEAEYYRGLQVADQKTKSQYSVLMKTDPRGNVKDYVIADPRGKLPDGYTASDFLDVGDWNVGGMKVKLQKFDEDAEGNARAYLNGVTLLEGESGGFDAPEGSSADIAFAQARPATNINPDPGDFVTTPDGKAYVFGGFDGKSNQWHYVSSPEVTQTMGWWDQYKQRNTNISFDEVANELIDGIGEPLTVTAAKEGRDDLMNQRLSEIYSDAERSKGLTGGFGESLGTVIGNLADQPGFTGLRKEGPGQLAEAGKKALQIPGKIGAGMQKGAEWLAEQPSPASTMKRTIGGIMKEGAGFFKGLFGK